MSSDCRQGKVGAKGCKPGPSGYGIVLGAAAVVLDVDNIEREAAFWAQF